MLPEAVLRKKVIEQIWMGVSPGLQDMLSITFQKELGENTNEANENFFHLNRLYQNRSKMGEQSSQRSSPICYMNIQLNPADQPSPSGGPSKTRWKDSFLMQDSFLGRIVF